MPRFRPLVLPLLTALTLAACAPASVPPTAPAPTPIPAPVENQSASPAGDITTKIYSPDEVATHNTPEDCWLALEGKVYDVSGFGAKHAGGEAVYQGCGTDATTLFQTRPMGSGTPHSDKALGFLPNFYIGDLAQ